MGAPINAFEIVESIRFFAQLVSTEGVSDYAKTKANTYIERLVFALEDSVNDATAKASGLIV